MAGSPVPSVAPAGHPTRERDGHPIGVELEEERHRGPELLDFHAEGQDDPELALGLGQVGEAQRRIAAGPKPCPSFFRAQAPGFRRQHVQPAVIVEADVLAAWQHHGESAHLARHVPVRESVQAQAPGTEPAGERATQVGRERLEREPFRGEQRVDALEARPRADHRDAVGSIHGHVIEARHLEEQATVIGHRATERRGAGTAGRDPDAIPPRPLERGLDLAMRARLEDQVGDGAGQHPGEERPEVDVLVAIQLGAEETVGEDPVAEVLQIAVVQARAEDQGLLQARGQLHRPAGLAGCGGRGSLP